ncbi:hypothetical protein NEFER01_1824 [Nematocida sp. LUAm1]|nr:hypothetical protein NEFER02_1773 [Nematocida sp. LUAm2]KAI5178705.1 hypothetical protein NEFER01_1824 [Nematocida sp. LUAm1]
MERRVHVKGNISRGILKWIEEKSNKEDNKVERVREITEKMKGIVKLKEIKKGGILSWITREPILVELEGVRGIIGSTLTVGKDKKKSIKGKIELPNILSKIFEVSNLLIEGSIKSIKGTLSIGEMNKEWKKEESPVLYKWKIEGEAEKTEKRVSIVHGFPGVNAASRKAIQASFVKKEETDLSVGLIHALLTENTKGFLHLSFGRLGKDLFSARENYMRASSSLQGLYTLFSLYLPEQITSSSSFINRYISSNTFGNRSDITLQLQGRMNIQYILSYAHRRIEEIDSSASLRILYKRIGAFIGISGGILEEPVRKPSITPIFGGIYTPTGSWLDSIEVFWRVSEIKEAEGILNKIQSMSIHLSKEY